MPCYMFPFSVFCAIRDMLMQIQDNMLSIMPMSEWAALGFALIVIFLLLCLVSLLKEAGESARANRAIACQIQYSMIIDAAIAEELNNPVFCEAWGISYQPTTES